MIKMVATDIDGTILDLKTAKFTDGVKNCIKRLKNSGVKVVLVTGRMHESAKFITEELELQTPLVSYQGGLIKDVGANGKVYYEKNLNPVLAKEIIDWAKSKDIHINLYMNDILYVEKDDYIVKRYTDLRNIGYTVSKFEDLELKNINKLLAINYEDTNVSTECRDYLSVKYPELSIVKSSPYFCEISDKNAKKSCAVEFLRDMWNINREEVLTIGDQDNDVELLKAGGIKIAMGNGTPKLKECADFITDTVENDGFVKAVEKFVLA